MSKRDEAARQFTKDEIASRRAESVEAARFG